ncbi:hypothetical protein ORM91_11875 [Bacillus cereus]|uniref:hypothetical protein n=1 Tax=Bacillus cereus TaxID=1396 RepID=UPI002AC0CF22|nr:hypothetical protein [Bacillus cereus]MDZ4607580.1 hypothetical protein [Bacillus cereus]
MDKTILYISGAVATVVIGVLGYIVKIVLNMADNEISKEQRFIETINAERVKWINTLRDTFSEYNKIAYIQLNVLSDLQFKGASTYESELKQLIYLHNHIDLFLNPAESITKKFCDIKNIVTKDLHSDTPNQNVNYGNVGLLLEDLHFLQQVILKSEWKRVKEENMIGKEITDQRMNEIYVSIAQKIDNERYNNIFNSNVE